jgi:hypothetical protein
MRVRLDRRAELEPVDADARLRRMEPALETEPPKAHATRRAPHLALGGEATDVLEPDDAHVRLEVRMRT